MWYSPILPRRSSSKSDTHPEAGPSTSPVSPKSGTRPAVVSTYPPEIYNYDPRTPSHHRRSLGRVEESPDLDISPQNSHRIEEGRRGSLVARDYADGAGGYPYANSPQSMTISNGNTNAGDANEESNSGTSGTEDLAEFTTLQDTGPGRVELQSESGNIDGDEDSGEEGSTSNRPRSITTAPSIRRTRVDSIDQPFPPDLVPPPSVHDTYLSKYIQPIVPTSSTRPTAPRSTSVPVLTNLDPNSNSKGDNGLLPPVDLREAAQRQQTHPPPRLGLGGAGPKPIFEIFDAEPGAGSKGLVSALKGHLEDVLKVQEEIGRMHLALEGLDGGDNDNDMTRGQERKANPANLAKTTTAEAGTKGQEDDEAEVDDSLSRREKGLEALMDRLGQLSDSLRSYHDLGTPKLQFPSNHKHLTPSAAGLDPSPSGPAGPAGPIAPSHPGMTRQQSAHPDFASSSSPPPTATSAAPAMTRNQIYTSPQSGYLTSPVQHPTASPSHAGSVPTAFPRSPLVHKGIDGLRRQEGITSPLASPSGPGLGSGDRLRNASVNSDLPDLPLQFTSLNDHATGTGTGSGSGSTGHSNSLSHGVRRKPSMSSQDLTSLRRDRQDLESAYRSGSPDGMGSQSQRATSHRGQRRFDSPIEMVDRSRPW